MPDVRVFRARPSLDDAKLIGAFIAPMHAECGLVPPNPGKAFQRVVDTVMDQDRSVALIATMEGIVVGSAGMVPEETWYGDGEVLGDLWFYTPNERRGGPVAKALLEEIRRFADEIGLLPLITVNNPRRHARRSAGEVAIAIRAVAG